MSMFASSVEETSSNQIYMSQEFFNQSGYTTAKPMQRAPFLEPVTVQGTYGPPAHLAPVCAQLMAYAPQPSYQMVPPPGNYAYYYYPNSQSFASFNSSALLAQQASAGFFGGSPYVMPGSSAPAQQSEGFVNGASPNWRMTEQIESEDMECVTPADSPAPGFEPAPSPASSTSSGFGRTKVDRQSSPAYSTPRALERRTKVEEYEVDKTNPAIKFQEESEPAPDRISKKAKKDDPDVMVDKPAGRLIQRDYILLEDQQLRTQASLTVGGLAQWVRAGEHVLVCLTRNGQVRVCQKADASGFIMKNGVKCSKPTNNLGWLSESRVDESGQEIPLMKPLGVVMWQEKGVDAEDEWHYVPTQSFHVALPIWFQQTEMTVQSAILTDFIGPVLKAETSAAYDAAWTTYVNKITSLGRSEGDAKALYVAYTTRE